ncbi:hypothetical protein HG536_0B06140 [Torulaspora globosa]|uniref:Aminopeptidase P N-terminal domain-containing protein n=1 Tax=Torulaspora globosa TaxID=48254 RepID=A0A7G3ZE12_9SACH|nr:uncharacterized protein HG536_0B06140 [Torulaspora globosa]QLL31748.1 hypothetical protein HG536_0B06140 [Torulaspora globosa]
MHIGLTVTLILCCALSLYSFGKRRRRSGYLLNKKVGFSHIDKKMAAERKVADGNEIPKVLEGHKYPAKAHNLKVKEHLLTRNQKWPAKSTAIFIAGEELEGVKYCDISKEFRQNRYFYYLSGVNLPGCAILFNFSTEKLTLFLPNVDWDDVIWSGMPISLEEAAKEFDVDEVHYTDKLEEIFGRELEGFTVLTTDLDNVHSQEISQILTPSEEDLFHALDESRLIKDWYEIETIRKACEISDNSHLAVMRALPIELSEIQIQAEFSYHATRQGARALGYDPICCSGPACGTLHYVKNSEKLAGKSSVLIDAGAEWRNYTSDVTRCFPISGKFTREHREIYETVRDMQNQVMKKIKPGAHWESLHILSHKILIRNLLKLGIFKKRFSEEEILQRRASCAFYPHGLGHLMGLDVHDVGGKPNYEDPDPYFRYLRLRRPLQENMVVTNEPGCYFNEFLINEFLNKYPERAEVVDSEVLKKYMYIGGVRIEDDILVTRDGCQNLNKITSDPDEIERIVSEGLSKAASQFHIVI